MNDINLFLSDEQATARVAAQLGQSLKAGDFVALYGDLGAGKTAFARALIQSLNPAESEVPSPTFTLVQTYDSPHGPISHFDLYRLGSPEDVLELGFEEMAKGILLVEWPERLGRLLPQKRFEVWLSYGTSEAERTLRLCCPTGRSLEVKL